MTPVLLRLSLAGNLEKTVMSLYVTEWRERGYGYRLHVKTRGSEYNQLCVVFKLLYKITVASTNIKTDIRENLFGVGVAARLLARLPAAS
jgi:hypothetical protein